MAYYAIIMSSGELYHHGILGQKWGVRRYQTSNGHLTEEGKEHYKELRRMNNMTNEVVRDAIKSGLVLDELNKDKQLRHIRKAKEYVEGRSYFDTNYSDVEKFYKKYSGKGDPIFDSKDKWTNKERVTFNEKDAKLTYGSDGSTNKVIITYSKTGSHMVPGRKEVKK